MQDCKLPLLREVADGDSGQSPADQCADRTGNRDGDAVFLIRQQHGDSSCKQRKQRKQERLNAVDCAGREIESGKMKLRLKRDAVSGEKFPEEGSEA